MIHGEIRIYYLVKLGRIDYGYSHEKNPQIYKTTIADITDKHEARQPCATLAMLFNDNVR